MPPKVISGSGTIAEIMEALQGASNDDPKPSPPEILVITLREYLADFQAPCRFQVGDLVTPKHSSMMGMGHGRPFIVLEVFPEPIKIQGSGGKVHNTEFGGKFDMRVLHEMNGVIVPHVVESWMFERFVALAAPTHEAPRQTN